MFSSTTQVTPHTLCRPEIYGVLNLDYYPQPSLRVHQTTFKIRISLQADLGLDVSKRDNAEVTEVCSRRHCNGTMTPRLH